MEQVPVSCSLYYRYDRYKNRGRPCSHSYDASSLFDGHPLDLATPLQCWLRVSNEEEVQRYHFGLGDLIAHNGRGSRCGIVTVVGGRQTLLAEATKLSYPIERTRKHASQSPCAA